MPKEPRIFRVYVIFLFLAILLFFVVANIVCPKDKHSILLNATNLSIDRGMIFLYGSQLHYGEFRTFACKDKDMINCYFDSSPFVTSFVLYSIKDIKNVRVKQMTDKGIEFLLSEEQPGGVWSFWTSRNSKSITPDLDCISTISFILKLNNKPFGDNAKLVKQNRDENGLFYTWLDRPYRNDIDCVVNANVLLYLQETVPEVCSYINEAVKSGQKCSIYYPNKFAFYYMVSRASKNNIACFDESSEIIISDILSNQKLDGSFGSPLNTAFAINSLIDFGYSGKEIGPAVEYLIAKQNMLDGSWPKDVFFVGPGHYGLEEFSTAIAIEALNKFIASETGEA